MFQFLHELATLRVVQASKTVLPSRDQPTPIDEWHFKDDIVCIAVGVGFDQLHVRNTVKINTVVQVGDQQTILFEVGMCTVLC